MEGEGEDVVRLTIIIIIIIRGICNAPPLRLKALNKHGITRTMYIEMENVSSSFSYKKTTMEPSTRVQA